MNLTNRTKLSLTQFLDIFEKSQIKILFEKYSIFSNCRNIEDIKHAVLSNNLQELIKELIFAKQTFRNKINPKYTFEERWSDFEKCLFLDGYKIQNKEIISIEPTIDGVVAFEDKLTNELINSTFSKKEEVKDLINESAEAFKNNDFNQCLSKARISLETIVRTIAIDKYNFNDSWGNALSKLKTESFITQKEEELMGKLYSFISDGSHIPLGFTEQEYVRYSRNLATSKCYYIIKKYKQQFQGGNYADF
ncbi:MAG: hypothetical protein RBT22_04765 [Aliarcobacter sp.]|jgi:hypothetical protein|nr:hypothetical protein [Aliarcobacter sp.]